MKRLALMVLTTLSLNASALTLDCKSQVYARYSELTQDLDVNVEEAYSLAGDQNVVKKLTGKNSGQEYVLQVRMNELDNGVYVTYGLYENYRVEGNGSTGKPLAFFSGALGLVESTVNLAISGADDSFVTLNCVKK
jgi:hypothetical protein